MLMKIHDNQEPNEMIFKLTYLFLVHAEPRQAELSSDEKSSATSFNITSS